MRRSNKKTRKTHYRFNTADVNWRFTLTITKQELNQLVSRIIEEGIGDWGIIIAATKIKRRKVFDPEYTLPIKVLDIETGKEYIITKAKMLRAIGNALIDFPYALDTKAGYNLAIHRITVEDADEIIQLAAFHKMQYKFV